MLDAVLSPVKARLARRVLAVPESVRRRVLPPPREHDGRRLDRQVQLMLTLASKLDGRSTSELTVEEAREGSERRAGLLAPKVRSRVDTETITLAGRPARIYRPARSDSPPTTLYWLHGGGHTIGSLDSYDGVCRRMAADTPCVVVSLDYRLGPEHRFPAAADDATAGFRELVSRASELGLDPSRIVAGGDSAGGNLACVVGLDTREESAKPMALFCIYPVVDYAMTFPSVETFGTGLFLQKEDIAWFRDQYIGEQSAQQPRVSPWYAESVEGLPPSVVMVAGFDPLYDEGIAWAKRLEEAGVPVELEEAPSLIHGFWNMSGGIRAADRAFEDGLAALRRVIRRR